MRFRIRRGGQLSRLILLLPAALVIALVAGCGGDTAATATPTQQAATPTTGAAEPTATPGGGEATPTPTAGAAATATPAPATPTVAPTDDRYGGVLNLAYFRDPTPPDGYQSQGGFEGFFLWTNNESILGRGPGSSIAQEESLAEEWSLSDDGMLVTFKLREGVQFQGGLGEMTAEDVVFSFSRWTMPGSAGCEGCAASFSRVDHANIRAVDQHTVEVPLNELDANIIVKFTERNAIIHSKAHWEAVGGEDGHKSNPIGTGAYRMVEWRPGTNIKYVRHDDWWQRRPYADEVNILTISETRTRLAAIETGQVNMAFLQSEMIPAARANPNIDVWFGDFGKEGWRQNHAVAPIDDIRVRRALVKSIDRDALNTAVYLDTMYMSRTTCNIREPDGADCSDLWQTDWLGYDVAGAKALVEEYAAEKGLTLPLQLRGAVERRPDRQQLNEFLQGSWREIGIEYTWETTANVSASTDLLNECQIHTMSTGGGTIELRQIEGYHSRSAGFAPRVCNQELNPEDQEIQDRIDELIDLAAVTLDDQARNDMYREVDYLTTKYVFSGSAFPLMNRANFFGCDNRTTGGCGNEVTGENPNRGEGFYRTSDFWVKQR